MPRRQPTPEQLAKLRDYYRSRPPSTTNDHKAAGIIASVTTAMAMRAFARGWPGIESIETQLARERALQAQSLEVLKAERVVVAMKSNVVLLQNEVRRLQPAIRALTDNLIGSLDDLKMLRPETAIRALARIAKVHRDVSAVSVQAVELDRLVNDQATSIVGVKQMDHEPVDLVAVKTEIEAAQRALRRAEAGALLMAEVGDDGITSN